MEDTGITLESCGKGVSANASWNRHGEDRRQRRKVAERSAAAAQG